MKPMASPKRLVIIGGVAGGATAAARARRTSERIEIVVLEKGRYVSFANCGLPYFVGGDIAERDALLLSTAQVFRDKYNIDVRTEHEALRICRERKVVEVLNLKTEERFELEYDALILSPGAKAIVPTSLPNVRSSNIFVVKTVPDADAIKACIEGGEQMAGGERRAVIVGGGFIGLETAEAFKHQGFHVTVVELLSHVLPPFDDDMAAFVEHHLVSCGIELVLKDGVKGFLHDESDDDDGDDVFKQKVKYVQLQSGKKLPCDVVVLSIGVRGEVTLALEAGLAVGSLGGIAVDKTMRSLTDKLIFCVGDAVEVPSLITGKMGKFQLAGPAQKQSRVAATNAAHLLDPESAGVNTPELKFYGALGTAIVGVLGITAGCTGLAEQQCQREAIEYRVAEVHPMSHVGYYPGAKFVHIKLIYRADNGKILGAQVVGVEGAGVDKRIDVISTAITGGLTVEQLEQLDLAYAPQFGAANDPVAIAGMVAADNFRGDIDSISSKEYERDIVTQKVEHVLVDVRSQQTFDERHNVGAVNIPLMEIRTRVNELPKDGQLIVTTCRIGLTAYIAARMLHGQGFPNVKFLRGGITSAHARLHPDDASVCKVSTHEHLP